MSITAADVKALRDRTGAGMMDAKKALTETNGDIEAALDWLRTKGIAKAAKKASRVAAEGTVIAMSNGNKGALVEVNAETDFAAKNEAFKVFALSVAQLVLETGETDVAKLMEKDMGGQPLSEKLTNLVATVGENMQVRRAAYSEVAEGTVGAYVHMGGKIGVLATIEGAGDFDELSKQVAMHVAASSPQFLNRDAVDPEVLNREKAVYEEQARESGKPEAVMAKMVEGRMNKFAEEICLVDQAFVMDTDNKVGAVVEKAGGKLTGFQRFGLGEGIEKQEADFAAEVAATMNS